jgi:phytoene dehydrogenase-like protein
MTGKYDYDAVVVGAGPNGLAAAITLAKEGLSVLVMEAANTIGGGARSAEVTQPGFIHDICSTIHPMGVASPFFRQLNLKQYGLDWAYPDAPLAHPFDDGPAVILERSTRATAQGLGEDEQAYFKLMDPLVKDAGKIIKDILGPFPFPPAYPLAALRFGIPALRSYQGLVESRFKGERARAMFAALAAHSFLPPGKPVGAAFGLALGFTAHAVGWPLAHGGSQKIIDAMAAHLRSLGGEIVTGTYVRSMSQLPATRDVLFDLTPRQILEIAGDRFPGSYKRRLSEYRYGPGVFKIDWALSDPIPWKAPECSRAATVHLAGKLESIVASENAIWKGEIVDEPFVLLVQPTLFDCSRAPTGKHIGWAYCHVPHGSTVDMTSRIEAQVERFAPGFRDCIISRKGMDTAAMQEHNPNYIGGDINGGVQDFRQLFTRPVARRVPYSTPDKNIFICSSSTPPGGSVHGMCGFHAAQIVLRKY